MSLKRLLIELATDTLFHFTRYGNVLSIIENDEFNTTNVVGSKADEKHNKKGFYMFSTQRSGSGKLGYALFKSEVRIVIDGRKLSQRYRVKPVDYMNISRDPNEYISKGDMLRNVEMEDRVITDHATIPNASSYVSRIDVIFDPNDKEDSTYAMKIDKASEGKFDVYFFTEDQRKDWENQRTEKAVQDLSTLELEVDDDIKRSISGAYGRDDILMYLFFMDQEKFEKAVDIFAKDPKFVEQFNEYYSDEYSAPKDKIEEDFKDHFDHKLRYVAYPVFEQELKSVLRSHFHNNRSSNNKAIRDVIHLFTRTMRQLNLTSIDDVVSHVVAKAKEYYDNN